MDVNIIERKKEREWERKKEKERERKNVWWEESNETRVTESQYHKWYRMTKVTRRGKREREREKDRKKERKKDRRIERKIDI